MGIKLGSNNISKVYLGSNEITKIYLGNNLIYDAIGGGAWTPSNIATALWLDASDEDTITQSLGSVSQWNDKSNNGYHATQAVGANQPTTGTRTINSLNTIEFIRTEGKFMSLVNGFQPSSNNSILIGVFEQEPVSAHASRLLNCQNDTATRFGFINSSNGTQFVHNTGFFPVTTTYQTGISLLGGYRSGATQGVRYDGAISYTLNSSAGDAPTLNKWFLGCYDGASEFFGGAMAEIIIVLSYDLDTRQKLEGYLAHKWGLTAKLPELHPYKSSAPTV